jgi:putative ABC transport system permease protein
LDKDALFCVIGLNLVESIKAENPLDDVLGKQLRVGKNIFTIVGTLKEWPESSFMDTDVNNAVIVPLGTSLLMGDMTKINDVIFRLKPGADIVAAEDEITKAINQVISNVKLNFHSSKELIVSMNEQHSTFTWLLGFIGGISLLVGGIGVMNIMLVSVMERRREIGIRRAVGARSRDIQYMFLTEAIGVTVFGGMIGVILGIIASYFIAHFAHWKFFIFPLPSIIGFTVSVLSGVFFGFYPAFKASKLSPLNALRSE